MSESQCEQCQQRYTLLKRKKQCNFCGQEFCTKCAPKLLTTSNRACTICLLIRDEKTSNEQLSSIRIRHLRAYALHSKLATNNRLDLCIEKQDLINLIQTKKRNGNEESFIFVERLPTYHTNVQQPEEIIIPPVPVPSVSSSIPPSVITRATLRDVSSIDSIYTLTIRQLKEILTQNFVSIKGCVEKNELIKKVEQLYRDQQQEKSGEMKDDNLCKICMDANIDCVFLDCGHLCTCVQCGKQLAECPICRAYIVRLVRVFKS